jgi:beta-galactosidase
MHAGLLTPDDRDDVAAAEVREVAADLARLGAPGGRQGRIALLVDYAGIWQQQIEPQGRDWNPLRLLFECYSALRALGQDVDILSPLADLSGYRLVVAPVLPIADDALVQRLGDSGAVLVFGPRAGSRTAEGATPPNLPPGPLARLLGLRVPRVESLRPGALIEGPQGGVERWFEHVEGSLPVRAAAADGRPLWLSDGRCHYLAGWPDAALMAAAIGGALADAGLRPVSLPEGVRLRSRGSLRFAFNYSAGSVDLGKLAPPPGDPRWRLGEARLGPAGVACWAIG